MYRIVILPLAKMISGKLLIGMKIKRKGLVKDSLCWFVKKSL